MFAGDNTPRRPLLSILNAVLLGDKPYVSQSLKKVGDKLMFVVPTKLRITSYELRIVSSASLAARHCTSNNSILAGECPRNFLLRNS